jgi:hypothetical protein
MSEDAEAVIRAAQHSLIHGGQFLENLPRLVIKIGKGRLWSSVAPRGRGPFVEFSDFATHPLPDGLGSDIGRLIDLCKGNDQAVKFLEAQRGREQKETVTQGARTDITSLRGKEVETPSGGNGSAYLLRRLARLGDEWVDRYEAGEFKSVRQAAIAAGIVKVPNVIDKLRAAWKKATKEERLAFLKEITP